MFKELNCWSSGLCEASIYLTTMILLKILLTALIPKLDFDFSIYLKVLDLGLRTRACQYNGAHDTPRLWPICPHESPMCPMCHWSLLVTMCTGASQADNRREGFVLGAN